MKLEELCPDCNVSVQFVDENLPYSLMHFQCPNCDGTFNMDDSDEKIFESVKKHHKGQKYGEQDYFHYHLINVAEMSMRIAESSGLNRRRAYIIGLMHDLIENCNVGLSEMEVWDYVDRHIINNVWNLTKISGITYYDYIHSIDVTYALLVKEADILFHLTQPDAARHKKYEVYKFALDVIRMKRILGA